MVAVQEPFAVGGHGEVYRGVHVLREGQDYYSVGQVAVKKSIRSQTATPSEVGRSTAELPILTQMLL